ncbi:MAG TPA: hypothetical protein VLA43_00720 [Longimicrobiales bacterium]|nr:hypothetical protein [Longimicrobiales bacterium]
MDESSQNLWYQLGYALERAKASPTRDRVQLLGEKLAAFREGGQGGRTVTRRGASPAPRPETEGVETLDWILASISGALVSRALREWKPRRRPGLGLLARSAAAGAAAIIFQELAHALLSEDPRETARRSRTLGDRLVSGAARGLVYGAIAEPRLPGPPVLRGVAYGTAEFFLSPLGGVGKLLGREAPYSRIPLLRLLLEDTSVDQDGYVEHLVFGLALALMAGETHRIPKAADDR